MSLNKFTYGSKSDMSQEEPAYLQGDLWSGIGISQSVLIRLARRVPGRQAAFMVSVFLGEAANCFDKIKCFNFSTPNI